MSRQHRVTSRVSILTSSRWGADANDVTRLNLCMESRPLYKRVVTSRHGRPVAMSNRCVTRMNSDEGNWIVATIKIENTRSQTPSKEGIRVELTKSHQDLASELGTVRELVSRNLGRLQAEGFLE